MTWFTGTVTGNHALLDALEGHLSDEGWVVNKSTSVGTVDEIYFEAPGLGDGYENYCALRTIDNSTAGTYCLELRASTGFDTDQPFDNQPGVSTSSSFMRLWNGSITYWLSVSDRRFILIAKVSNTYHSMYAGFFNAFGTPPDYPYPYYQASDASTVGAFGAVENNTYAIAMPGFGSAMLREVGGLWRYVAVYNGTEPFQSVVNTDRYNIWPYGTISNDTDGGEWTFGSKARFEPLPGLPDSLFAQNCYICSQIDSGGILGTLEGVYWIPGNGMSAEQQITIDANTYRAFIAISRSIEQPDTFYAIKEL